MVTKNFPSSLIASYIKMINNAQHKPWKKAEDIVVGDIRISNFKKYIARSNGKTGSIKPVHESGELTDGGINWMFVEHVDNKFSIFDNVYLGLGHTEVDLSKEDSLNQQALLFEDLIFLTKLKSEDMRICTHYINWTDSIVYDELDFDNNKINIIKNDDNNLYYCIGNNNGLISTVKPESNQFDIFQTPDGYLWKYIGNINDIDKEYITSSILPISSTSEENKNNYGIYSVSILDTIGKYKNDIDYVISSNGTNAKFNFILNDEKQLKNIWVSSFGQNYDVESYVTIFESGSIGTGALATANIVNGKIDSVIMDNIGYDYNNGATAFIIGDGIGAKLECNIDAIGSITSITPIDKGKNYTTAKIFIIPGVNCSLGKAKVSRNTIGTNLFNEIRPSILSINKIINTIDKYIDATGPNSKYNFISLIAGVVDKTDSVQKLYYVGPKNSNYNGTDINKIDKKYGMILYNNKFPEKQRADGQEERIKIQIELS